MRNVKFAFETMPPDHYALQEVYEYLIDLPNLHNESVKPMPEGIAISFDVRDDIEDSDLFLVGVRLGVWLKDRGITKYKEYPR